MLELKLTRKRVLGHYKLPDSSKLKNSFCERSEKGLMNIKRTPFRLKTKPSLWFGTKESLP